ncbi:unnamed protein product, partial [Musa textilis]
MTANASTYARSSGLSRRRPNVGPPSGWEDGGDELPTPARRAPRNTSIGVGGASSCAGEVAIPTVTPLDDS